jgi:poly(hydroxyalkanoate) synthase III subunit E
VADKDKVIDPMAMWRDMLSQWETSANALANKTMASDEYSSSMHGAMGGMLKLQDTMKQFMATYLASANLPSRAEVLAIAERIGGVEARLDRMNALLERIAEGPRGDAVSTATLPATTPARPRPPRTKSPPVAEPK